MNKIEAVIFDMDGLLFDTEKIGFRVWKATCEKYGYTMDKEMFFSIIARNARDIKQIMIKKFGENFDFEKLHKEKSDMAVEIINSEGVELKKGAVELIDFLVEKDYKIALATSSRRERAFSLLEKVNMIDKFTYVICGDEVEKSKPDPDIFLKVAKKLGVKPEKCMVLEDSEPGVRAAVAAGMIAINVPDMKDPDEEIINISYKVSKSLLEVKELLENV